MDSSDTIQLIILACLIMLSAFFSSAETAFTTISYLKIKMLVDDGNKKAIILQKIVDNKGKMLSAVLIGNNIVNISASALATVLATNVFGSRSVGLVTGILTIVILILGEISPKTMATIHAEKIALAYAKIIYILMTVLTPAIWFTGWLSRGVLRIMQVKPEANSTSYTESELRTIVDVSHEEGVLETEERKMIKNVFDFGNVQAKDVMVPRIDMIMSSSSCTYDELIKKFQEQMFTRIPIYENTTDNIIGIVNMKDIILYKQDDNFDVKDFLREPFFTYEYKNVSELLYEMKETTVGVSIVLDEYGDVAGLITLEDIIEEIVGEIRDEYDMEEEDKINKISDSEYIVDGALSTEDINDAIGTEFSSEDYDSIAGIIIEQLDRLPSKNDTVEVDGCKLTVLEIEKNRINRIRIIVKLIEE